MSLIDKWKNRKSKPEKKTNQELFDQLLKEASTPLPPVVVSGSISGSGTSGGKYTVHGGGASGSWISGSGILWSPGPLEEPEYERGGPIYEDMDRWLKFKIDRLEELAAREIVEETVTEKSLDGSVSVDYTYDNRQDIEQAKLMIDQMKAMRREFKDTFGPEPGTEYDPDIGIIDTGPGF